jgi:hypothetical protein
MGHALAPENEPDDDTLVVNALWQGRHRAVQLARYEMTML